MKTIEEIRLENLKTLCAGFKSQRQFAIHLDKEPKQINQLLRSYAQIGSALAREIEEKCEKPRGWLDHDHAGFPVESTRYVSPMLEN